MRTQLQDNSDICSICFASVDPSSIPTTLQAAAQALPLLVELLLLHFSLLLLASHLYL